MKRIVLALVLVGAIGGVAEARSAPLPVKTALAHHTPTSKVAKAAEKPHRPSFVGFLVKELIWPGLKKGAEVAVAGAVVAAL
jgi:hypothetical protein